MTTATRHAPGAAAPDERERSLFSTMLRLRRFEEKAGMLYALGTLGTPCPLGVGQEGAIAAIAATLNPGDIVLTLDTTPAFELALGAPWAAAFQRLQPAPVEPPAPPCLVRIPGEPMRQVSRDAGLALAAQRSELIVLIASCANEIRAVLETLPAPVLPVIIIPTDRKPETWSALAPSSVRECDGADAIGLCETLAAVRHDLASGHAAPAIAILTPPYAGHARDLSRRAPSRRETPDPIALCRQRLLATRCIDEAGIAAIEAAVRDEVAAAGRAVAMACT